MAVLILSLAIAITTHRSATAQELTAGMLLRPYIENLNAKHDDVTQAIEIFKTGDFIQAKQLLNSVCEADTSLPPSELLLATMFQVASVRAMLRLSGIAVFTGKQWHTRLFKVPQSAVARGRFTPPTACVPVLRGSL